MKTVELVSTIKQQEVADWIDTLKEQLQALLGEQLADCAMIGIRTGGAVLGAQLHRDFGMQIPFGQLNISFYRDDFSHKGLHPVVDASDIPFSVDEQTIILVDDVLQSGRTIRAAMNEIFDYGRPARIVLAVLVDRGNSGDRELPIQADALGHRLKLATDQHLKLDVEELSFQILHLNDNQ